MRKRNMVVSCLDFSRIIFFTFALSNSNFNHLRDLQIVARLCEREA